MVSYALQISRELSVTSLSLITSFTYLPQKDSPRINRYVTHRCTYSVRWHVEVNEVEVEVRKCV